MILTDDDAHEITEAARRCQDHPGQKLRLQSLNLRPETDSIDGIRALLSALDDVEEISLHAIEEAVVADNLRAMLQLPSLRSLAVNNIQIPTMDIFSSFPESHLQSFDLCDLWLTESASMVAFVKSLNPHFCTASPLSSTLQNLSITETDGLEYLDVEDDGQPLVHLAVKDVAAVAALEQVLASNKTLRFVNFVGVFANPPAIAASEDDFPARTSLILAPLEIRRCGLAMARKAAFLSAIRGGNCKSARQLDSNVIHIVLAYSAPLVVRKVRFDHQVGGPSS